MRLRLWLGLWLRLRLGLRLRLRFGLWLRLRFRLRLRLRFGLWLRLRFGLRLRLWLGLWLRLCRRGSDNTAIPTGIWVNDNAFGLALACCAARCSACSCTGNDAADGTFITYGGRSAGGGQGAVLGIGIGSACCTSSGATAGIPTVTAITTIAGVFLVGAAVIVRINEDQSHGRRLQQHADRRSLRIRHKTIVEVCAYPKEQNSGAILKQCAALVYPGVETFRRDDAFVIGAADTDGGIGGFNTVGILVDVANAASDGAETALQQLDQLVEEHEKALLRQLARYPEVVAGAALASEPHTVATYLRELAADFHTWYNAHKMLVEDAGLRNARVALCAAVRQVIANGLGLLGVSAPEAM